ncbi:PRA1 family protein B4-like [Cynara cardunculus var. scolymus]|uniref:PRA1 family protein n=1 Tax=Cynara cardunculus var. scolymus TaxID=59895 RepID=A0A124SCU3_CYNCS|nr:PRA1 family protein B4-like [Cynara cardunculus var. scolymus]KVH94887.1 hypothetical protein Ccrd_003046 [Cynara cardunculus var. scolymus]
MKKGNTKKFLLQYLRLEGLNPNDDFHFDNSAIKTNLRRSLPSSILLSATSIFATISHRIKSTMVSSSPAILPISNPQTNSAGESQSPVPTTAFGTFTNHITETLNSGLSQRRPWSQLADRSGFSKPESVTDATTRIQKNYAYFRVNYLIVVAAVVGFSLLTNPFSLITLLGLLAAWLFLYLFRPSEPPLVILGRTISERETLGVLIVCSIVVIFLTSVGSILISALLAGIAIVCVHGAFRTPDDLFVDEQESTGFSPFLSESRHT